MRLQQTLSCFLFVLFCFFSPFSNTFQIDVSAEDSGESGGSGATSYPVALTSAQTLALYGQSIPALYYNGASVGNAQFEFYKSSLQIVNSYNELLDNNFPWLTGYNIQNPIGMDFYVSGSKTPHLDAVPRSENLNDISSWIGEKLDKSDICSYEFLIYRWQGDPDTVHENIFDFEFNFDLPIDISGVDRLRTAYGVSLGTWSKSAGVSDNPNNYVMSGYIDSVKIFSSASVVDPFYIMTPLRRSGYSGYQCKIPFPVTNAWETGSPVGAESMIIDEMCFPAPNVSLCCIDTNGYGVFDWSSVTYNVRSATAVVVKEDGALMSPGGSLNTPPYVYLFLMCPVIWGDVTMPEPEPPSVNDQFDGIGSGIGDINVNIGETNHKLDLILQKLDQIYQKEIAPQLDVDLTEQGPLSWLGRRIDSAASSIVSGVCDLFVPSQTDLINFRLNLQNDFQTHFPAFFTAEDKLRNMYSIFDNSVNPRSVITVPLVQMSIPDVANQSSADFSFGGFDVELKPHADKLGILYDSLAVIIDFIATLAVLNMLRRKFHRLLEGGASE